ncbi:Signal-induced proliferation-associated 1-like protein 2 [Globomyces sp. JEL0801]|nr:Signal-induced proliferation-associated 1-like protein 2 [Globomyces sp. JEL0801]
MDSVTYHKTCFKCTSCKRILNPNICFTFKGKVFCNVHKPTQEDMDSTNGANNTKIFSKLRASLSLSRKSSPPVITTTGSTNDVHSPPQISHEKQKSFSSGNLKLNSRETISQSVLKGLEEDMGKNGDVTTSPNQVDESEHNGSMSPTTDSTPRMKNIKERMSLLPISKHEQIIRKKPNQKSLQELDIHPNNVNGSNDDVKSPDKIVSEPVPIETKVNEKKTGLPRLDISSCTTSPSLESSKTPVVNTPNSDILVSAIIDDRKSETIQHYYNQTKLNSIKIIQSCDRLKSISQDSRIPLHQEFVAGFRNVRDYLRKVMDCSGNLSVVVDLKRDGVDLLKYEILMTTEFLLGNGQSTNAEDFRRLIERLNTDLDTLMKKYQPTNKMMIKNVAGFKEESYFDGPFTMGQDLLYHDCILEHVTDCTYYRRYFFKQEHVTFIGVLDKWGPVIISMKRDDATEEGLYHCIFRARDHPEKREQLRSNSIKKSFLSRKTSTKQVIQLLDRDINLSKLKQAEQNDALEAKILKLDELKTGSEEYETFLSYLGTKVELKGYHGFTGGLDPHNGRTGTHMITNNWKENDVIFHCATMLPFSKEDVQQIERKRHIGNDGEIQFDPKSFKTQFTHVFIVVKKEIVQVKGVNVVGYRIAVTSNVDVPKFGPPLPNPPVFHSKDSLYNFIMSKLINGENAAFKAPKFSKPNERAHHAFFDEIVEENSSTSRKLSQKDRKSLARSMILSPTEGFNSPKTSRVPKLNGRNPRISVHTSLEKLPSCSNAVMSPLPGFEAFKGKRSKDSVNSLTHDEQVMGTMQECSPLSKPGVQQ